MHRQITLLEKIILFINLQNIFAEESVNIIKNHAKNGTKKPFFLYLAFQSVHGPLQVPKKYIDMYPEIQNEARKYFSGRLIVANSTTASYRYQDTFTSSSNGYLNG